MDWLGDAQAYGAHRQRGVAELLGQTGLLVLGARAGAQMAQAWPGSTSPTGELHERDAEGHLLEHAPHPRVEQRARQRPAVEDEVPELKREPGKDIVVFAAPASPARSRPTA